MSNKVPSSYPGARIAPLLLRCTLGALFITHLYWKFAILPGGLSQWWSNFAANGYPSFVPYYVFSAEVAGAVLLIPGIYVRWVSLYAMPMMLGAAYFWGTRNGFYFTASGAELPLVWLVLLILQAMLGDGPYRLMASTRASATPLSRQTADNTSITGRIVQVAAMSELTSKQAYLAMFSFLDTHYQRTKSDDIGSLLGSMSLLPDGIPADPAIEEEWRAAVQSAMSNSVDANMRLTK